MAMFPLSPRRASCRGDDGLPKGASGLPISGWWAALAGGLPWWAAIPGGLPCWAALPGEQFPCWAVLPGKAPCWAALLGESPRWAEACWVRWSSAVATHSASRALLTSSTVGGTAVTAAAGPCSSAVRSVLKTRGSGTGSDQAFSPVTSSSMPSRSASQHALRRYSSAPACQKRFLASKVEGSVEGGASITWRWM